MATSKKKKKKEKGIEAWLEVRGINTHCGSTVADRQALAVYDKNSNNS